jgi:nucleoside diphosphate kinase
MPTINQALLFFKPHVMHNRGVVTFVEELLDDAGLAIVARRSWESAELRAHRMADRHYATHARAGTCLDPAQLTLDAGARQEFALQFHRPWEEAVAAGRVLSGLSARERLQLSADEFHGRWAACQARKLASGLYVAHFAPEDLYVLNGFYPAMREVFLAPDAAVEALLLEFEAEHLSWRRFREEIIGATNPAAADEESIRGLLYDRQQALGVTVCYHQNVVHASASAFEALGEKALWLPELPLARDPLWQALEGSGIPCERLQAWREENPCATLAERTAPLLDLLENLDTTPTAEALRRLAPHLPAASKGTRP